MVIPEQLVQQFRVVALERLDRVETAWGTVLSSLDDESAELIHREVHTLKGESQMLGFADVNIVCHKLEDLLEVARTRGYAVDEDFDLAINMALRFMAMLVRKKVGSQLQGIDLAGFIRQIDGLLAEVKPETRRRSTGMPPVSRRDPTTQRVPQAIRASLGPIAVDIFIEYAVSRGPRRDRMRTLVAFAARSDRDPARGDRPRSAREAQGRGPRARARDLGKQLEFTLDVGTAEVTVEMLAAIDTAVLHLVRNAVDHGIEPPEDRVAHGKSPAGNIVVRCGVRDDQLVLVVKDDGRGVDLEEVLDRALALGLTASSTVDARDKWFEWVCQPGFSTRLEAGDVSGRGVGLDAVRAAITDVGGTLTATTVDGQGTVWTAVIPLHKLTVHGMVFRSAAVPFPIVVDDSWRLAPATPDAPVLDLGVKLGLVEQGSGEPRYITSGTRTIGIAADRPPTSAQVRRLVVVRPPAFAEIVTLDMVEGLLIHPERLV